MEEEKKEIEAEKETVSEKTIEKVEKTNKKDIKKSSKKKKIILGVVAVYFLAMIITVVAIVVNNYEPSSNGESRKSGKIKQDATKVTSEYRMSGNSIENFDLAFLRLENGEKNTIYSPLSIKYTLEMLGEGADGDTKAQIDAVIGDYKARKYNNNDHMSFANALFIRDSYKDVIKSSYVDVVSSKYNADVIFDSFQTAATINNWVKDKTFNLIDSIVDDDTVQQLDYALTNALAIDMNWNYLLQKASGSKLPAMDYDASYIHENYSDYVMEIFENYYPSMSFNGEDNTKSVQVAATLNNYDIVSDLGEDNIRKTVGDKYDEFLATGGCGDDPDRETYLDQYMKEIKTNYKKVDISTDFTMLDNDEVKAFAKDLKEYDGVTLQYVGIMPKNGSLVEYVKGLDAKKVQDVIDNLKEIKSENFEDGSVINIKGNIPLFNYGYELELIKDLQQLGITDVFESDKADLSKLTSDKASYIAEAKHKANIEFSNEGIKAAAVTFAGGAGAAGCYFDHSFDVPVKKIDISFDKPYMYIIRDKKTGEVWFVGTVYQPSKNS